MSRLYKHFTPTGVKNPKRIGFKSGFTVCTGNASDFIHQDRGQNKFPALDADVALTRDLRSHVTDEFQFRKLLQVFYRQPANH